MKLGLRRGTGSPERKRCRPLWSCSPTPGPLPHISPLAVGEPLPGGRRPSLRRNVVEPGALSVFRSRAGWHQRRQKFRESFRCPGWFLDAPTSLQVGNVRGSTTALLVPMSLKVRATSGACWKDAMPWNTTGSYSVIQCY